MSQADLPARLEHLEEAARQLLTKSPTVSALLGSERQRLALATDSDLQKSQHAAPQQFCKACGIPQVAGLTCRVHVKRQAFSSRNRLESDQDATKKKHSSKSRYAGQHYPKTVEYLCLHCNRSTYYESLSTPRSTHNVLRRSTVTKTPTEQPVTRPASTSVQLPQTSSLNEGDSSEATLLARPDKSHAPPSNANNSTTKATASATARARAKARKKGGLAALVAKQSGTGTRLGDASSGGLSLMDFMQGE